MEIDHFLYNKLSFINNCLNEGWCVKKRNDKYIFYKKHLGNKKYFKKKYVKTFVNKHLDQ